VELIDFLKENIEDYPTYAASSCYATQPSTLISKYDNSIDNKHFGI